MSRSTSRTLLCCVVALVAALVAPVAASAKADATDDGQVVRDWTDLAFAAVRNARAGDAVAARLYAMVDTAMYDAVNGLSSHPHPSAIVPPSTGNAGDRALAAARAAYDVLSATFPALQSAYNDQIAEDRLAAKSPGQAKHGEAWGARVAAAVIAARANDGSQNAQSHPAESGAGKYRSQWNGMQFKDLAPFAIADPSAYVTSAPPALDTPEYAVAFNDVKARGNGNVADPAALATYQYWSLGGGTSQPPGAWLQVAEAVSSAKALSLDDTARLFALTSMALVDTVAPTYSAKDRAFSWRPITAIREAETDGNDATTRDPFWNPRGGNSTSPEFWSGHSSFSAAGAAVLAGFFCDDNIPFTLGTDSGNGAVRSYASFSAAAAEAGASRVLGGLHFEFSNQAGLAAGRAVAAEVLARDPNC
ncbi:MAG: hypothetical protein QOF21_981 [Actinomycetota bacterium]